MTKGRTAREIRCRFHDEQGYIERYTRFLGSKSTIHDHQVLELNRILERVQIDALPTCGYDRTAEPYSHEEMAALLAAICKVEPEVYQTILGHEQCLDHMPDLGLDGPAAGHLDQLGEWIEYVLDQLPYDVEDMWLGKFAWFAAAKALRRLGKKGADGLFWILGRHHVRERSSAASEALDALLALVGCPCTGGT